jgi:hypothetical protein
MNSNLCDAQLTENRFHISGRFTTGFDDSVNYRNYTGSFEWHVHKNVGMIYSLDWMERSDGFRIIHTPAGIIGAPLLLFLSGGYVGSGWFLLYVLAMPDGVALHLPFRYKWDFSPYGNIAGIDFITDRATNVTTVKYASSFGLKTTYMLNSNFVITALVESRYTFGQDLIFGGGLGFGYAFGERRDPNLRRPLFPL